MRNFIWIGAILVILGAAGIGLHEVDATQADVLSRTIPAGIDGGSMSSALATWVGLLIVGIAMMLAGRRALPHP
jgi:hypothetical protein